MKIKKTNKCICIVLLFISMSFSACDKDTLVSVDEKTIILNRSEKTLFFAASTDVGADSAYISPHDSAYFNFRKEQIMKLDSYGYADASRHILDIEFYFIYIYSIYRTPLI